MKNKILTLSLLLVCMITIAQTPQWQWTFNTGGTSQENATNVTVDANGNSIVTGMFTSPTLAFDTIILTRAGIGVGQPDMFIAKFDSTGNVLWAKNAGGINSDRGVGVAVDNTGNIFLSGNFGSPTITLGSFLLTNTSTSIDIFLAKYDAFGNVLWAKSAGGIGGESGYIALDSIGNVYISGSFTSPQIYFGNDTITKSGSSNQDAFIFKFDSTGNEIWARSAGGIDDDLCNGFGVDFIGNIYITGQFKSSTFFIGDTTLINSDISANSYDMFIAKYDAIGNFNWAKKVGGLQDEFGSDVKVDINGNPIVTGSFEADTLFIGSNMVVNSNSNNSEDIFIAKFDSLGNSIWLKGAGGTDTDAGLAMASDRNGNTFLTGYFHSTTIAFDTISLTNSGLYDTFIAKYNESGNILWAKKYGGTNDEFGNSLTFNTSGIGYLLGDVYNSGSLSDIFLKKFTDCVAPVSSSIVGNSEICQGELTSFTITALGLNSYTTYSWSGPNSFLSDSSAINNISFAGQYNCVISNGLGCSVTLQKNLIVNPLPNVIANSTFDTLCFGQSVILNGSGANNYSWNNSVINGVAFNPTSTNTYTVTGIDTNGCINTATKTITVNSLPNVIANSTVDTVCFGQPVILNGSGANTYSWNNSVINGVAFNPTSTNVYTVTGTDTNGCTNTSTKTITVNPLPNVIANSNVDTICLGQSVTLNGAGANTYFWNNSVVNGVAFNPSSTNSYTVTGTDTNGCTNSSSKTITVNPLPVPSIITANGNTNICNGDSVILHGNVGGTWNNLEQDSTIYLFSTGNYFVTNTNSCGSVISNQINVTVNPLPIPTIFQSGNDISCQAFSAYQWFVDSTLIPLANSQIYTPLVSGNYTVGVIDSNGCSNISSSFLVTLTGIKNVNSVTTINVFPNPFNDIFSLQISTLKQENVSLSLYNISGEVVKENTIISNRKIEFNNSDLPSGMYFLKATLKTGEIKIMKLVKGN